MYKVIFHGGMIIAERIRRIHGDEALSLSAPHHVVNTEMEQGNSRAAALAAGRLEAVEDRRSR